MDPVAVGAIWLHLLATVTLLGYYAVLAVLVLPVLRRTVPTGELVESMAAMERRALPIIIGSLVVFLATGIYLMGTNTHYSGVGQVGSTWASVILVKHLVVVGMVGVGLFVDALIVRAAVTEDEQQAKVVDRVVLSTRVMTVLAAIVLLLTAVAQAS